ncbi:MAG: SpoIIE family protein phosphatase [Thermoleophilaceae bacterium]|nr:SpoIIE family protein phosphatase [Thermoleophilaceae bacterium]
MSARLRSLAGRLRRPERAEATASEPELAATAPEAESPPLDIAPNDPIIGLFESAEGPVDLDGLELDSPALEQLRAAGIKLAVPLVSQGELIGVLNLGPRLSEQDYSSDDRKLLANLAAQAAPAVRVGQLVREQEAEARSRERIEQELAVAQLIQQNFLPKQLPDLPGWQVAAFYRPAREVGGDFYDFIELGEGRLGIVIGDVTDKGVPAAMVMAATRSVLRASAQRLEAPGEVLARVNDQLCPDMPDKMFVTCFYAVLERESGRLRFANAGHDVPYLGTPAGEVEELRARGMPLGLMPGMIYEEKEATLGPGDTALLYSDGLAEAHDPEREMFGFPRVKGLTGSRQTGHDLIDSLLTELDRFTGPGWEQEDDITLVTLSRSGGAAMAASTHATELASAVSSNGADRTLTEFEVASAEGNERGAMERVAAAVAELGLPASRLERLKTAVAEATMNAMEHGNGYRPELAVTVRVLASEEALRVRITDHGGDQPIPAAGTPDLEAKLAGEQKPRGWGLFLIEQMVDEMRVSSDESHHTVELGLNLRGDEDGDWRD